MVQTDTVEEEQVVESDDDEDEDAEPETETVTVEKDTLYIEATPQMTMNQQWMFSKQQIAQDIMQRLDIDRVIVQETSAAAAWAPRHDGRQGRSRRCDPKTRWKTPTLTPRRSSKRSKAPKSNSPRARRAVYGLSDSERGCGIER